MGGSNFFPAGDGDSRKLYLANKNVPATENAANAKKKCVLGLPKANKPPTRSVNPEAWTPPTACPKKGKKR